MDISKMLEKYQVGLVNFRKAKIESFVDNIFSENSIEDQILSEKEMINFKTSKES